MKIYYLTYFNSDSSKIKTVIKYTLVVTVSSILFLTSYTFTKNILTNNLASVYER